MRSFVLGSPLRVCCGSIRLSVGLGSLGVL
jgi:hypothetical protein